MSTNVETWVEGNMLTFSERAGISDIAEMALIDRKLNVEGIAYIQGAQ